jgi:tetratricopeptide (TPR) repeat protein
LLHGVDLLGDSMDHVHLYDGDRVTALGHFSTGPEPPTRAKTRKRTPSTPSELSRRLQQLKADPARMARLDVNRDGTVDAREWEAAVRMTRAQLARESPSLVEHEPSYLTEPAQRETFPFIVAVGSQHDARRALLKQVLVNLLAAVVAGVVLAIMLERMTNDRAAPAERAPTSAGPKVAAPPSPMTRGAHLLKQGRAAEAAAVFDRIVQKHPDNIESLYWRGSARMQAGQTEAAVEDLETALHPAPDRLDWFGPLVRHYGAQGDWTSVLRLYDRLLDLHPDHAEALLYRGGTYRMQGDMAKAEADLRSACGLGHPQACRISSALP